MKKLSEVTLVDAKQIIKAGYSLLFGNNSNYWKIEDQSEFQEEPCLRLFNRYNDYDFYFFSDGMEIHLSDPKSLNFDFIYLKSVNIASYIEACKLGYYIKEIDDHLNKF